MSYMCSTWMRVSSVGSQYLIVRDICIYDSSTMDPEGTLGVECQMSYMCFIWMQVSSVGHCM